MQTDGISELFRERNAEVPHIDWEVEYQDASVSKAAFADPIDSDELQMVERAKAGNGAAMRELLESIRSRCMAAALRILRNSDEAQDALQDAFLKIWKSLPTFEGRSSFSTWTHRIVVNACLDIVRQSSPHPFVSKQQDLEDDSMPSSDLVTLETPEDHVFERERSAMLRCVVDALPAAHRQVIKLREFDDLAYDEMAKVMGCPIGTVMSRIHHARKRLAQDLICYTKNPSELLVA